MLGMAVVKRAVNRNDQSLFAQAPPKHTHGVTPDARSDVQRPPGGDGDQQHRRLGAARVTDQFQGRLSHRSWS